ncbi:Asparagine synthetase domain-containing protein 1 [Dichanthelium oligosanthes]|uniref:Asparagine synthetase domain-containing protein 1 n=1 Tax=Dichanthelium oligosanthes TaxID=888268 RepID=A0A1E5V134_9POAL|nr:Asparagine synthetase domain-containing protein 1 [Dichanthelium oligosanthes]
MCGISLVLSGDHLVVAPSAAAAAATAEIHHSGEGKGVSVDELKEALRRRGPDSLGCISRRLGADGTVLGGDDCNGGGEGKVSTGDCGVAELCFIGATLHLRGAEPVAQPLVSPSGSVLVYNGNSLERDVRCFLFSFFTNCRPTVIYADLVLSSKIDTNTIWFGRDAFGRRSLLVHWPTADDSRFVLSSVSPPAYARNHSYAALNGLVSDPDMSGYTKASYWEELPCGIYSIHMKDIRNNGTCVKEGWIVEVNMHEWMDSSLNKLIQWERKLTVPTIENDSFDGGNHHLSQNFITSGEPEENNKNGVTKIDLVSDSSLCSVNCITQSAHRVLVALRESVMRRTKMNTLLQDLNIGIALWLAAGGDGWVDGSACLMQDGCRHKYKSRSRVLIVGSGADEQCAGYGRHRTKYRLGGWNALDEEMRLDVQRIWKRNMGRDDRCISDHGKEARFPFLDENVIKTMLEIPLWEIAKLNEPVGKGDKKILREVARLLGLQEAALQPKRAIQRPTVLFAQQADVAPGWASLGRSGSGRMEPKMRARRYEWLGKGQRRSAGDMSGGGGSGGGTGDEFGRAVARAAVAQALEAAGFDCAHRSAVDAVVDVLLRYISHLGRSAAFHANLAGRALANELDVIQALEEVGADTDGFAGAAATGHCLAGSGVVRDLMAFVDSKAEVPFARQLPRFPVPRVQPQPAASFAAAGRETGMRHVPEWLPVFPDPHTYVRTEAWIEPPATKDRVDKVEQVRQRRKAEKSLLSLQQRLAQAGAEGFHPAVALVQDNAEKGKEIQAAGTKRNPFLEPALPPGEKDVSEVDMPPEKKKLSVLEAFAPAIQATTIREIDAGTGLDQNQRSIVPKERAPIHLKIGFGNKSVAAVLNSRAVDLRDDPSFLKEETKDDRKRRAGMILRASMENPQELPQL